MKDQKAKEMMLADAIATAIEQSYLIIRLKRTIKLLGLINAILGICIILLAIL